MQSPDRIPVAVLGATGLVGRRLVALLAEHPWFELCAVAASDRSVGRRYGSACRVRHPTLAGAIEQMTVLSCESAAGEAPVVFSALDSDTARRVEPELARRGALVFSNASAHRLEPDVPLVVPEVNPDALDLLGRQRRTRGWAGGIVCNPNCVVAIVGLAVHPLQRAVGIRRLGVTTLQAVSGAGHPGLSSVEILANVIPWIEGEEAKIRAETTKLFGDLPAVGVQANRVPVLHGHMACLAVECGRAIGADEVDAVYRDYRTSPDAAGLPSSPPMALEVVREDDRPQPVLDADRGGGMTVTVGRLRSDPVLGVGLVACGHNLVRGAAGAALLNAELAVRRGLLGR